MEIEKIIPFCRDLLVRPVPIGNASVTHCVLKSFFIRLAKELNLTSLRLFLFNDATNQVAITHIYGERAFWNGFDITRLRKERTKFNKLFFVKLRHIKENGQFVLLGYLGYTTNEYVTNQLQDSLEVLCLLYGNYIVKKVVRSQRDANENNLQKLYTLLSTKELPGTIILGTLNIFQKMTSAFQSLYITSNECNFCFEYLANKRKVIYLRSRKVVKVSKSYYNLLLTSKSYEILELSAIPMVLQNFILFREQRPACDFYCEVHPVFVDSEMVGQWMFVYSKVTPFDNYNISKLINNIYSFNKLNYKFLFQRRFNKMIVNPIFQNRDTRINGKDVFVIMPFVETWSSDVWEQVISVAVKEMGMTPLRADNLYGQNIMEDVWTGILKSAIIICDTTNRNPNVFYELGIAHTLGKKIILLTQNVDDIPFDLQTYRHIVYSTSLSGGSKLKEDIKSYIRELTKD